MAQLTSTQVQDLLGKGELAGDWVLDQSKSSVLLKTRHTWGLLPLNAAFGEYGGHGTITAEGGVTGVFTVKASSLNTRNPQRDKHLRSADFFDVANHENFTFTVDSVTPNGKGVQVAGNLTIRDTTRPVSFDATVDGGDGEATLDAEVPVNRADYGLTWNKLGIAPMQNTIVIHAVFVRQ